MRDELILAMAYLINSEKKQKNFKAFVKHWMSNGKSNTVQLLIAIRGITEFFEMVKELV
jgi:hypothetical protein